MKEQLWSVCTVVAKCLEPRREIT